jgi:hypothetical protein
MSGLGMCWSSGSSTGWRTGQSAFWSFYTSGSGSGDELSGDGLDIDMSDHFRTLDCLFAQERNEVKAGRAARYYGSALGRF